MTEGNYSNVGHRGPVYKGLGAMNPCDLSTYYILMDGVLRRCSVVNHHSIVVVVKIGV
jgi:hypothetical protein